MISLVDFLLLPAMAGWKEGRKEGWGGVWLPMFVGLKSQSSWQNRGGWRGLSYRLPITI